MIMISKWMRIDVPHKYMQLTNNLIKAFKHKFKFEINSPIYCVASLFNVSKLHQRQFRSDCDSLRKMAIENITMQKYLF